MNGKEMNGKLLYVGRAQKWLERQNELKLRFEQLKQDQLNRCQVRGAWGLGCHCFYEKESVQRVWKDPVSTVLSYVVGR